MTTTVTIAANHGWPVDVEFIPVRANAPDGAYPVEPRKQRIPAGETLVTCVHSGQDIRVTEIQPDEIEG